MRIGLIGLGRIGRLHAAALAGLDTVDELVVTDALPAAVESAVAELDVRAVAGTDELLRSDLDGLVIASSTPTHLSLLEAGVNAGIPTFCEKPLASDPAAASGLVELVARTGTPVQVGFPRRFDPAFLAAKSELDSGRLGWLTTVRSTTLDPAPPPAAYVAGSGGIYRDCAIHDLDAIRWVTGQEVVEVYVTGTNQGDPLFAAAGDVDTASALLTLDGGTIGVVSNSRYNGAGYDVRLELHGSDGAVAAGFDDGLPLRSADPAVTFPAGPPHTFFLDRFAVAFRRELAVFVEVAAGRQSTPCSAADGLETSWVAEACTLSQREHRPVRLDEIRPG